MPYKNKIQSSVTFEIDSVKYELKRDEFTLFEWFAAMGGLGSVSLAIAQILHLLESPHYFVTAAMVA